MSTDYESILHLLHILPEPAVKEVADFTTYIFQKYVKLPIDEQMARRKANAWLITWVGNMVMAEQAHIV